MFAVGANDATPAWAGKARCACSRAGRSIVVEVPDLAPDPVKAHAAAKAALLHAIRASLALCSGLHLGSSWSYHRRRTCEEMGERPNEPPPAAFCFAIFQARTRPDPETNRKNRLSTIASLAAQTSDRHKAAGKRA